MIIKVTEEQIEILIGSAGNHSTMNELLITRIVVLVDIALIGPAVMAVERDWGLAITPLEIVLLSAIVAVAFVAIRQLHQIALSQGTQ